MKIFDDLMIDFFFEREFDANTVNTDPEGDWILSKGATIERIIFIFYFFFMFFSSRNKTSLS